MKTRFLYVSLLLCLSASYAWADVPLRRFEARTVGDDVQVSFSITDESNVREIILERKTRFDAQFREIKRFNPQGNNRVYEHLDDTVYKDQAYSNELVQYRLKFAERNNSNSFSYVLNLNYFPTAIRRTWGSIKAMFQ
jgi:hypothetical protein